MASIITLVASFPLWGKVLVGIYCVVSMFLGFIFGICMGGDAGEPKNMFEWCAVVLYGLISAVAFLFLFPFGLAATVIGLIDNLREGEDEVWVDQH